MTPHRVTGPGPRTVALPRVPSILAVVFATLVVVACGTSTAGPTAAPGGSAATTGPSTASTVTGASAPSVGPPAPGASQPRWPGTTVLAVIALGAADGEIQKAGNDLQAAADNEDLKAMWGAADGLAKMIESLMPNLDRLDVYPGTQPVEALYRKAFPELDQGAKQLRDSITSGDSAGVEAGSQEIAQGLVDYTPIREQIAALVVQAILQPRLLLE
jgi:hypothetical protein